MEIIILTLKERVRIIVNNANYSDFDNDIARGKMSLMSVIKILIMILREEKLSLISAVKISIMIMREEMINNVNHSDYGQ